MAAKDWIVHKNVIEIHGYFPETVAKAIKFCNSILQWSNSCQLKTLYPGNLIIVAIPFMTSDDNTDNRFSYLLKMSAIFLGFRMKNESKEIYCVIQKGLKLPSSYFTCGDLIQAMVRIQTTSHKVRK